MNNNVNSENDKPRTWWFNQASSAAMHKESPELFKVPFVAPEKEPSGSLGTETKCRQCLKSTMENPVQNDNNNDDSDGGNWHLVSA